MIGEIIAYAGATSPKPEWLVCDGSSVLQSAYPDLFALIGTTYGPATGGNFTLPDLRGRSGSGVGTGSGLSAVTLGQIYGEETHVLTVGEGPTHTHIDSGHTHTESAAAPTAILIGAGAPAASALPAAGVTGAASAALNNSGNSDPHNTIGPRLGLNYLIVALDG